MGHCFISYSNRDAENLGPQLSLELEGGHPHIETWYDKQNILPGQKWDSVVSDAIKTCKSLLFVMTKDSVTDNSICAKELNFALKYKRPIFVLRFQEDVEPPLQLGDIQWIDFCENHRHGIAQVKLAIQRLDSPEGQLDVLKDRLSAAERDLNNAKNEEEKLRAQVDVDDLKKQIQIQERIVANPQAAKAQTQANIEAGLERERQPEKPVAGKTSTRFINPPPGIAPNYFQDRLIETKQIVDFLNNDSQRLMTIVGRAGVGKTAMICRLLKGLENGNLPDDLGEMKIDGIVYLSETGSHRVNFANVFADLSKLLPRDDAERLEGIYKNPQTSTGDKMRALLDAFPSGRVILLLDNFETLIDPESLSLRDSELSDALNALLGGQHHAVKAVITTRIAPRDLAVSEPGRQHHLSLDEGLESPYAENVLREMDADGRVGLKTAPDALLNKAREKTRGYPRALEALYAILSVDRYTTLEELLEISLPDEVVQKLVGEAFNRLDPSAQKVMQALAVYNRPVSPAAIDYLLQPHLPSIDSALVLNRLVNMHFARKEAGRYYLHPADREYAFSTIPEGDKTLEKQEDDTGKTKEQFDREKLIRQLNLLARESRTDFTHYGLLDRAADYFAQARKPRTEWKKLDDLAAQLAEFELRCKAGDYDTALNVVREIDFDYLLLWGHYQLMISLHENLIGKIVDRNLVRLNFGYLGLAYESVGKTKDSIKCFEQAIEIAKELKDRFGEAADLGNLGNAYAELGNTHKAIEFYEQALVIDREIGNRMGEESTLTGLGNRYSEQGDIKKAIEFYEQALVIDREIGDHMGEGIDLGNIGNRHADLGDARKAIEFYEQALIINREIGNRRSEGIALGNIAEQWINLAEYELAIQSAEQYVKICDEINKPASYAYRRLAEAFLHNSELTQAREAITTAQKFDEPQNNHNISTLMGIIALRQGERETAQEAFTKSIAQADEILAKTPEYYSALDAKGLALCGKVLSGKWEVEREKNEVVAEAVETFRKARKIAPHAGVVKSVLRLFDELVKCDGEGILKGVREVIAGTGIERG